MTLPRDRYVLRASVPVTRSGPGRRQQQVAMESYAPSQMADLLMRIEALLAQGHILSINPPAQSPTVDAALAVDAVDPTTATITVLAS